MASDNILKAVINVSAPNAQAAFSSVSNGAKNTEAAIRTLTPAISKLGSNLNALKFNLLDLKADLLNTNDISKVRELNVQIKQVESEIKRLGTTGASGFGQIGAGATKSLSFLRQLAFILPGIGVAGIFNVLFQGIEKVTDSILNLGHSYNQAAVDAEVFKEANKAVGDDIARLQALVSVARDVSVSTQARSNAIKELQKLYPDYLRNITLENINSAATAKAIDDLTKSIISKAVAQAYSTKVSAEIIKRDELHDEVLKRLAKREEDLAQLEKLRADRNTPSDALKKFTGIVSENNAKLVIANRNYQEQANIVDILSNKLKDATIAELEFVRTPETKKGKIENIITKAKEVAAFLKSHTNFIIEYEFDPRDNITVATEKARKFLNDVANNNLKIPFAIEPTVKLPESVNGTGLQKIFEGDFNAIIDRLQKISKNNPVDIIVELNVLKAQEVLQKKLQTLHDSIQSAAVGAAEGIAGALGEALAGSKSAGQAIIGVIAGMIDAIGKALVQYGIAKKSVELITKNPLFPASAAIALGLAAILSASILRNLKGFAGGGDVSGGRAIIVGEKGPEVFIPNTGGKIIPNNKIGRGGIAASGGTMNIQGQFVLRGADLIAAFTKANQSQSRLT